MASLIGTKQSLLAEKSGMGRTQCFAPVHVDADMQPGSLAAVRITGATATHLIAEALQ